MLHSVTYDTQRTSMLTKIGFDSSPYDFSYFVPVYSCGHGIFL